MNELLKYIRLYDLLKQRIENGEYKNGQKLPTEYQLTQDFDLSRQTVRQSLKMLESDGYIERIQGSGSYVRYENIVPRQNMTIAVITTYISEYIFPSILRGIEEVAADSSYSIVISATNNSIATERRVLNNLFNNPVDGIIAEGTKTSLPNPNVDYYLRLADSGIPVVFFNSFYPDLQHRNIKYVVADDYGGGMEAARKLVAEGHRDIGAIFKSDDLQGTKRFSGFIDGLIQYGGNMNDQNVIWYTTETRHTFIRDMCNTIEDILSSCTGFVCYNDEVAAQLMPLLELPKSRVRSVVSFDRNKPLGSINKNIQFYSLSHPKSELGRTAARKLLNIISGNHEESSVLMWEL